MGINEERDNLKMNRPGKTKRDKESGAKTRNIQNKLERVAWQKNTSANNKFPYWTCNGKKNKQKEVIEK